MRHETIFLAFFATYLRKNQNFFISEIEKRRKLGFYQTDHLYFYKSSSGFEIDLILEDMGSLKAIEVKSSTRPTKKDIRTLEDFVAVDPSKRRGFLFYMGTEYQSMNRIRLIPIAALYRGR